MSDARRDGFDPRILAGRSILVTGGGSGLGLAMATTFAAHGAQRHDRRDGAPSGSKRRGEGDRGGRARGRRGRDVRRRRPRARPQCEALVAHAAGASEKLDGLVNNAAGNFLAFSEALTPNGFDAVVQHRALRHRSTARWPSAATCSTRKAPGAIVSILATYAWTGTAFALPSACAKAGVLAMTRSLAVEWGRAGIRLNAIAPGPDPDGGRVLAPHGQSRGREGRPRAHRRSAASASPRRSRTSRRSSSRISARTRPATRHDGRRRVDRGRRRVLGLPQGAARDAQGRRSTR